MTYAIVLHELLDVEVRQQCPRGLKLCNQFLTHRRVPLSAKSAPSTKDMQLKMIVVIRFLKKEDQTHTKETKRQKHKKETKSALFRRNGVLHVRAFQQLSCPNN